MRADRTSHHVQFLCSNALATRAKMGFLLTRTVRTKTLRKHTYSNILKISPPKTENFQIQNSDIFHISAQNIDCRYSLEPPR